MTSASVVTTLTTSESWRDLSVRTHHVLDVANLCGTAAPTLEEVAALRAEYEREVALAVVDLVAVATDVQGAYATHDVWPQAKLLCGRGPDGADRAICDWLGHPIIAGRFDRVIVGSGDHSLAMIARRLRLDGLEVGVVFRAGSLSRTLAREADWLLRLRQPVGTEEDSSVRRSKLSLSRSQDVDSARAANSGPGTATVIGSGAAPESSFGLVGPSTAGEGSGVGHPADPDRVDARIPGGPENWRLILAAARALTAAGRTPFTRIAAYGWIWDRYPRSLHDRPSLDPTFQGMVRNATGGPRSACGTPFMRVGRGLFVLVDAVGGEGARRAEDMRRADHPRAAPKAVVRSVVTDREMRRIAIEAARPGRRISPAELESAGFRPLEIEVGTLDVELPCGRGFEWTTLGVVPESPGLYAFTVEDGDDVAVTYVGLTEHLWMVTKGRLPGGGARGGQRYGRPRHAGVTRQRINVLAAGKIRAGRVVRHWVRPLPASALPAEEERLIAEWELRRVGWNRR